MDGYTKQNCHEKKKNSNLDINCNCLFLEVKTEKNSFNLLDRYYPDVLSVTDLY